MPPPPESTPPESTPLEVKTRGRGAAACEDAKRPRVLIVRPSALGDVSRTAPALATLRRALPEAHIDWLVQDAYADAVRHHPALNGVVLFPRHRLATAWRSPAAAAEALRWAGTLRRGGYDIAIDLQGLFRSGLFTRVTGAPVRVGFADARELAWLAYNRRHRIDPAMHAVDRMLALLEAEGYPPVRDMRLYVGANDQKWLDTWLAEHGENGGAGAGGAGGTGGAETDEAAGGAGGARANRAAGGYACIAPTTRWLSKCWPIERFTQIAEKLLETGAAGDRVVILAAPGERPMIEPMIAALNDAQRVLVPHTTVGQMMALISRARLLVSNDSAALHVAVGFDRPIVAVFGPTDPALVGPYQRGDCVVRPPGSEGLGSISYYRRQRNDQSLIAQVTVEAVWAKVIEQMG